MTHELQSQPAQLGGAAAVVKAQRPATLRATIHVTRKATGATETWLLEGRADAYGVQLPPQPAESAADQQEAA